MLAPNNSNNQNIGDGLQVNAGRDAEVHYHEPPKPKSSAIQELLFNIIDIEKKESASLKDDDYRTYSIEDKIKSIDLQLKNTSLTLSEIRNLKKKNTKLKEKNHLLNENIDSSFCIKSLF